MSQIREIRNFTSKAVCDILVSFMRQREFNCSGQLQSKFDGRTNPYMDLKDPQVKRLVNQFRFNVVVEAREQYGPELWPSYTDLVYWPTGSSLDIHADNCWLDGKPNYCPERDYAGVLYLNTDYEGGKTYFEEFDNVIEPEVGKLVLFPAGLEYRHGVTEVTRGDRYTMPIWLTTDANFVETERTMKVLG